MGAYGYDPKFALDVIATTPNKPDPGVFGGMWSGISSGVEGIGAAAYATGVELLKLEQEGGPFNPEWIKEKEQEAKRKIVNSQIDPATTGLAGSILGGFAQIGGEALIGAAVGGPVGALTTAGTFEGIREKTMLEAQGVSQETAVLAGVMKSVSTAAVLAIPPALKGLSLRTNVGLMSVAGATTGMADRAATAQLLERDYPEMAKHYKWNDATATTIDLVLGGLMGAGAKKVMDWNESRVALREKGVDITPTTEDAARLVELNMHKEETPAIHTSPRSLNAYIENVNETTRQLLEGIGAKDLKLPESARSLDLIENPMADAQYQMMHDIHRELGKEYAADVDSANKAFTETQKKITELSKAETVKAEMAETGTSFLEQRANRILEANPEATITVDNVQRKAADVLKEIQVEKEEATKMGRLHKVAVACILGG